MLRTGLLAAVAAASSLREFDFGPAHPGVPTHGGFLREAAAPAVDADDQERLMKAAEIARELDGAPDGTQRLRAAALKPTDVTDGKMCKFGPDTSSEKALLEGAKGAVDMLYDTVNQSGWVHHGSDDNKEWAAEGGDAANFAHVYGEVEREGMFEILKTAACVADPKKCENPKDLVTLFRTMHFYDLGSGQGKFPMFASLLGFEFAKGIELDKHRSQYAERVRKDFNTVYPCLSKKFDLEHGSFIETDASWTKSSTRRVIFLDAVCFKDMWPTISEMMHKGKSLWGPGSVVVALGRDFEEQASGLLRATTKKIPTSWAHDGTAVNFYQFPAR